MTYIERNCVITHDGRTYEAGGAVLSADLAIGYLARNAGDTLILTDWHGDVLSERVRIVAMWPTPRSSISSHQYQIEVYLNDVLFTGRSAGIGMAWKGKPKRSK